MRWEIPAKDRLPLNTAEHHKALSQKTCCMGMKAVCTMYAEAVFLVAEKDGCDSLRVFTLTAADFLLHRKSQKKKKKKVHYRPNSVCDTDHADSVLLCIFADLYVAFRSFDAQI